MEAASRLSSPTLKARAHPRVVAFKERRTSGRPGG
ncbi:MAG: hypothetical protein ACLUI3_02170 [Christensenellales bacterium]